MRSDWILSMWPEGMRPEDDPGENKRANYTGNVAAM